MNASVGRIPILDINSNNRASDYLYPIQPYPWKHFGFPSKPFINLVAFYHQTRIDPNGRERIIYPAGNAAVVCRLNDRRPESFLVGTPTFPREPGYIASDSDYFVVLFWIGIGFCLFPFPPSEIVDSHIPLKEIFPGTAQRLTDQMAAAKTFDRRVDIFERFLSEIAVDIRQIPTLHQALIRKIYRASTMHFGLETERKIHAEFSDRHVRRLIIKYSGISPKLLMRIIRYQKTLHSINVSPNQSMACLAAEQGYFDQSHFIKEFKRFQGVTPDRFIRPFITEGDGDGPNKGLRPFGASGKTFNQRHINFRYHAAHKGCQAR
jgi:AraC-like DNA-binding protein